MKTLQFGNHRKYESNKPFAVFEVISSFVQWVKSRGGTPRQALEANESDSAEARFDTLYHAMKEIRQFGRTGRFDTLCLLGSMGLISVKPGSCYLKGSTGPLKGARKLFGKLPVNVLSRLADETAKCLEIAIEVFEDALCNWQKEPETKRPKIC